MWLVRNTRPTGAAGSANCAMRAWYAVCSFCNEGASNITSERPEFPKLKAQVKRAPIDVQIELLKWMVQKFPKETAGLVDGMVIVSLPSGESGPDPR